MALLCGIRSLAMTLHRVNRRETEVPNEKYAFRCFLLRLGMVGNDSKAQRKILLKNLSGSSAWRDGRKDGADDLMKKIDRLGKETDRICEKALTEGGQVMKKSVADHLSLVIGKDTKVESRSTGELQAALGVSPVRVDKNGNHDVKIGFREPRSQQSKAKGKRSYSQITNAMIANVLEYGRKGQAPKPFLAPAKKAAKKDTTAKMESVLREEIDKL